MRPFTQLALGTASVVALAIASPAFAQTAPTTGATTSTGDKTGAASQGEPVGQAADPAKTEAASPDQLGPSEVAQESGRPATAGGTGSEIVVTGTRINRPTLTSAVPITSVGPQDLSNQGNVSLGDKLAELPQIRATFTQANSTRNIGTAGINALDLRGLGTSRTLVLLNGRRLVTATPGINRPDVNTIPQDLLQRVDIVTGGNSAVYGSDAVAGVVNFVTKRDFDGFRISAQGGISSRKDRGSYSIGVVAGRNFADNRANVAVALEYAHQNTLYYTDRDDQTGAYSGRRQFQTVDITGPVCNPTVYNSIGGSTANGCRAGVVGIPAEPAAGDAIFDTSFLSGIRNNNISEGGLFTASCPNAAAAGESATAFNARRAAACSGIADPTSTNTLAQFGRTFVFQPDGTLIANPCVQDFRQVGSSNCVGGLGSTLRLTGILIPGLTRKSGSVFAHYDVSDAFQPFVEARYVKVDANQEGQPTFFNNTFSINNPFLTSQARAQLQSVLTPGVTSFTAQRFNVDFGGRGELHKRENIQVVGGVGGTFNGDWKYEVSLNYGHLSTFYKTNGNLLRANYANAIDAVTDPASGRITCRINSSLDLLNGVVNTANDDPACVPLNLFGNGAPSQAALNYILYTSSRKQKANLYDATAYVAGDSSQLFSLPGGPIAFVLGGEYRRETAFAAYDPITASTACGTTGCTFLNVIPDFRPKALKVAELFGELQVPILKDIPFFQELSLDAAGRYSHYNLGTTGGVFAWNVNGIWAPIRDIRFRAGYARSVRAPTQSDLYSPATQTFINNFADPCGQQNINNGPVVNGASVRIANCAAAGVPTTQTFTVNGVTTTEPFTNRTASGILAYNQGNANLSEERGRSLTIGAVVQPQVLRGLSVTVDYYKITVRKLIAALGGQQIINLCYDNTTGINNQFCAAIFRNANGTFAGQQNVTHAGTTVNLNATGPSALITSFNYAKLETSGIDVDAAFRRKFGDLTLNLRGVLNHTFKKNSFNDPTDPNFQDRILSELGDPAWQGQFSTNLEFGIFNIGHRVRFVGKQTIGAYETQHPLQGRPATNLDAFPVVYYPRQYFHDVRLDIKPTPKYRLYLGVDNITDRLPSYDLLGIESGAPSPVGRFFYAGVTVDL